MDLLHPFSFNRSIQIRWMDLDPLAHVNNSIYIQYFEFGRGKYMTTASPTWDWHQHMFLIANITCDYLKELKLTDHKPTVWVRTSRFGGKSFDLEYLVCSEKEGEQIVHAKGKSVQVLIDLKQKKSIHIPDWLKNEINSYEKPGSLN